MPHWVPSWQEALLAAGVLAAVGRRLSSRRSAPSALATEAALVAALFALWQFAGGLAVRSSGAAIGRGEAVWRTERLFRLPSETSLQHVVLPHPWLVEFGNGYYVYAHFSTLGCTLLWLFLRRRESYVRARNAVALTTFACLAVQLVPVAPPRLIPGHGIVDTAAVYGQSVYGSLGSGITDQLSALPSVHFAWALLVALLVIRLAPRRWRWIGPVHAALTLVVIVGTANHYWLDALSAAAVVTAALAVVRATSRRRSPPQTTEGARANASPEPLRRPDQAASTGPSSSVLRSQTGSGSSARSST